MEVSEEGSVCEVLQAGCVVRHDVRFSWNEEARVEVAVFALVGAFQIAQEGWCLVAGDSAFVEAAQGRRVVRSRFDGSIA